MPRETKAQKEARLAEVVSGEANTEITITAVAPFERPAMLAPVVQEYGLELADEKVDAHLRTFVPYVANLVEYETELNELLTPGDVTKDLTAKAKALRLKYQKVRTGSADTKAEAKKEILIEGTFLDKVNNAIGAAAKLKEDKCEEIEKHFENIAKQERESLVNTRKELLAPFDVDTEFIDLAAMPAESFERMLNKYKEAHGLLEEQKKADAEAEAKRQAEEAEQAKNKAEADRIFNERLAKILAVGFVFAPEFNNYTLPNVGAIDTKSLREVTDEKFNAVYDPIKAKFDTEAAEKAAEQAREKEAAERQANRIKVITALGVEYDSATESYFYKNHGFALADIQGMSSEDFKDSYELFKDKVIKLKAEEKTAAQAAAKKAADDAAEVKRLKDEAAKKLADEQAEKDRKTKEAAAALVAPDKEKFKVFYATLKGLQVPEFSSPAGKEVGLRLRQGLDIIINGAKEEAKKLV